MAFRRPSTVSIASSSTSLGKFSSTEPHDSLSPLIPAGNIRVSQNSVTAKLPNDTANLDPDEIFTKYTIQEVKFVQQKLKADADAKQEELRLMVGERYRDLLQASTSIISIARSSKRVIDALEETKDIILSKEEPPHQKHFSVQGSNDTYLQTLQLLSAHMKLLLDAPEHLWRLIERKKYFPATWLFLLSRVVYRALITEDNQDEDTWSSQGVDVLEQFPLVQRQWDAVSQFRPQIIHKATLSLREYTMSVQDTCATLLTLHLLDSRPLSEALSLLLSQRSKTLETLLSWSLVSSNSKSPTNSKQSNGHVPKKNRIDNAQASFRRTPVREVRLATQKALDAISRTVNDSRRIFQGDHSQRSLADRVLENIQIDSPNTLAPNTLPIELQLTTQSLLATLPSSTHFLLLPPNIRAYKPYVDPASSVSAVQPDFLRQRLGEWFNRSTKSLEVSVERWFAELQNVREVWNIRTAIQKWISVSSGLARSEAARLESFLDDLCRRRVVAIWKVTLQEGGNKFRDKLDSVASSLHSDSGDHLLEISSIEYLFQSPPLPTSQGAPGAGTADLSFQKYTASLCRQIMGRTSLLDEVLATLENCAEVLQNDIVHIAGDASSSDTSFLGELATSLQSDTESLCTRVIEDIDSAAANYTEDDDNSVKCLVFIGRVADELVSSPFIAGIGCRAAVVEEFRQKIMSCHDRITDRWREHAISHIVRDYHDAIHSASLHHSSLSSLPITPSSDLIQSLISLSNSLQQLGFFKDPSRQGTNVDRTLRQFITSLLSNVLETTRRQGLYDIAFLRKFAESRGDEWTSVLQLLDEQVTVIQEKLPALGETPNDEGDITEYFTRTQTLFAILLPRKMSADTMEQNDKLAALLPFGIPGVKQTFYPAVELAKPSSRFGLLLIEESGG